MVGVPKRIPTLFKFNSWLTIIESKDHGPTSYNVCPYNMVREKKIRVVQKFCLVHEKKVQGGAKTSK